MFLYLLRVCVCLVLLLGASGLDVLGGCARGPNLWFLLVDVGEDARVG